MLFFQLKRRRARIDCSGKSDKNFQVECSKIARHPNSKNDDFSIRENHPSQFQTKISNRIRKMSIFILDLIIIIINLTWNLLRN